MSKLVDYLSYLFVGALAGTALFIAACTTPVKPGVKTFVEISYCQIPSVVYVIDSLGNTHMIDLGTKEGHDNADKLLDGLQGESFDLCPPDSSSSF